MSVTTTQAPVEPARQAAPVQLEALRKTYGPTTALTDLHLTVAPAQMLAMLGPSGCGKTTALRVLAGFEVPDRFYEIGSPQGRAELEALLREQPPR